MGLNRLIGGFESVDGSVGLIVGSSDGGFSGDFFLLGLFRWCCFGFGLVLVLVSVFSSTLSHSLTCCWPK